MIAILRRWWAELRCPDVAGRLNPDGGPGPYRTLYPWEEPCD